MENTRLEALHAYALLDTDPHPSFDAVTKAAQMSFDVPIALVSLVDEYRQWFKSSQGLDARETPREISFCTHAIKDFEPMAVNDALKDARFAENPLVTGAPHIRFYAGAPLIDGDGQALGTLCIIDTKPRDFSQADATLLKTLSECAMTAITAHHQGKLLFRAAKALEIATESDLELI